MNYWNVNTELESKFSYDKNLGHTIKLAFAERRCIPKVTFTTLFDRRPLIMGVNYIFDNEAPKKCDTLEVLVGGRPYKNIMTYLKQYAANLNIP